MRIARFQREPFLADYFGYQGGEHYAAIEPTQQGKTHITYQCADVAMGQHPELTFVSLMPKSRDPATRKWAGILGLEIVDGWPPRRRWFRERPRGFILWPRHLRNAPVEQNRAHLAGIFRSCLTDQFQRGECITLADDVYNLAVLLGLNQDLEEHWTAGSGGGCGLWATAQKPSGTRAGSISTFLYNSPTHLMLGHDPVSDNVKRFSEIGGVNPKLVTETVTSLNTIPVQTPQGTKNISEKLYIHKAGPYMAIIGP